MAETQPGGIKEKEDVNATALAVSDIRNTYNQGAEKMASKLTQASVQESMTLVIVEEGSTNNLEKPKKQRKPRMKKNKNNSNTTEQAIQVQPAITNKASSSGDKMSMMNTPKNLKPHAPSAEEDVPEAISNQDPTTQVMPVIAEEGSTNNLGKPKKPRKPRMKKNKNNSNTTEQALQVQSACINKASSSGDKTSMMNTPKNLKPLAPSAEEDVPEAIFNQDPTTQLMPVIAEEGSTNNLGKPKKPRKPRMKKNKNNSDTTEQALQVQSACINKASSSGDKKTRVRFLLEPSTSKMNLPKNFKPLAPLAQQGVPETISNQDREIQVMPVIAEEGSTNTLGKPKKTRKPRMNKKKNNSEQALQMQPANVNKASSSAAEKVPVHFIQEPSTSKIYPAKIIKTSTPSAGRGVPDKVFYKCSMGQVLPVITEELSADILEKPKKQRKLKQKIKKNNSNTVEQAL